MELLKDILRLYLQSLEAGGSVKQAIAGSLNSQHTHIPMFK